jgi:hypothetical protein
MKLGLLLVPFFALTACSSSSDPTNPVTPDAATEASVEDDASSKPDTGNPSPDGGGKRDAVPEVCTTLTNGGQEITANGIAEAPPTLKGGTIADGTYFLTAIDAYTGPGGQTGRAGLKLQSTLRITGATLERMAKTGESELGTKESIATSGTSLELTVLCSPAQRVDDGKYNYEATPTSIAMQGKQFPQLVFRWTKQ